MKNIFVYGSLMFGEVWGRVIQNHYEKQTAVLLDYKRLCVRGEYYPGLVEADNNSVQGILYRDVIAEDIKRLDLFEGDYYHKIFVKVVCEKKPLLDAEVYLFDARFNDLLDDTPWDPVLFRTQHLKKFIEKYSGF